MTSQVTSLRRGHPPLSFSAGLIVVMLLAARPAVAQQSEAELRRHLAWQIALDQVGFSPGVIDGVIGGKTRLATREFQRVRRLPRTGELDDATAKALEVKPADVIWRYELERKDVEDVTGPRPSSWRERSKLEKLGYESIEDALAEKYHCTVGLLRRLNPGKDLNQLKPGDKYVAILPAKARDLPRAASIEINLSEKVIRVTDRENQLAGMFHCSIAASKSKRPSGQARVTRVVPKPEYTFNPKMWPEVTEDIDSPLRIPPGPRNPVGLCWIELSLPGYGIHGTPQPEMIGKTGSHGCFRMANWDALRLAGMVEEGTIVRFTDQPSGS